MLLLSLALAAAPPTPHRLRSGEVALLPSAKAVVVGDDRGLVRIDLTTGAITPVPDAYPEDNLFQFLSWGRTDDAIRLVSNQGLFDLGDTGPVTQLDREAPAGDVYAIRGDRLAYRLWTDAVLHIDGWPDVDIGANVYPRSAWFTDDGKRLIMLTSEALLTLDASGLRRTIELPYTERMALFGDDVLLGQGPRVSRLDAQGNLLRSYAHQGTDPFVLHDDALLSDGWLDLATGHSSDGAPELEYADADVHGGRLVVLARHQGATTLWTAGPDERALTQVWRGVARPREVHIAGPHRFVVDAAGDVHRFTDGQRTAFVDLPWDRSSTRFAFHPDGQRFVRTGEHGLSLIDVESGQLRLQVPSPTHTGVAALGEEWLVFDSGRVERRGPDLQPLGATVRDDLNLDHRGPWASVDEDRWMHAVTGQTKRVRDAAWNGTDLVAGGGWDAKAGGDWVAFIDQDDDGTETLQVRRRGKKAWTHPTDDARVAAVDDSGHVYLIVDDTVQVLHDGSVQRVLYLLPDGWAVWEDGALDAHGDTGGLR